MTNPLGGFELFGNDSDETRVLSHRDAGFSIAIPGHPTARPSDRTSPKYDVIVQLADAPVELGFRLDTELAQNMVPDALVSAYALAYGTNRAARPPSTTMVRGALLAPGAIAAARATYSLREGDGRDMEYLTVATRNDRTLYLTARFRTGDVTPMEWGNLRATLHAAQSWTGSAPTTIWPESAFLLPSVRLQFTDTATEEAHAKAREVGKLDSDEVEALANKLIAFANRDEAPATPLPQILIDASCRDIAMAVPSRAAEVLLRNIGDAKTFHDFRGWAWQCFWAVGNRVDR